jgi:hypothetical protein
VFDVLDAPTVPQKLPQRCFALYVSLAPQVIAVEHQEIKSASTRVLIVNSTMQRIEVWHSIRIKPDNFGVKNCRSVDPRCRLG